MNENFESVDRESLENEMAIASASIKKLHESIFSDDFDPSDSYQKEARRKLGSWLQDMMINLGELKAQLRNMDQQTATTSYLETVETMMPLLNDADKETVQQIVDSFKRLADAAPRLTDSTQEKVVTSPDRDALLRLKGTLEMPRVEDAS